MAFFRTGTGNEGGIKITDNMFTTTDTNGGTVSIPTSVGNKLLIVCENNNGTATFEFSGATLVADALPIHHYGSYGSVRVMLVEATSSTVSVTASARTTVSYAEV